MKPTRDIYQLYLVTDPVLNNNYTVIEQIRYAIEGGVKIVQIREKNLDTESFEDEARRAKIFTRAADAYLIINDNVAIAERVDADGVHLGQSDLACSKAREILGKDKIIGISVTTPEEAVQAKKDGADYIAANGVFSTDTKKVLNEPLGLDGINRIKRVTSIPLIAIGGIKKENCREVISAGADGVAIVTAITMAENIPETCREFIKLIESSIRGKIS